MAGRTFLEENGIYQIDFTAALCSTNQIQAEYHSAGLFLSDVDFVASTEEYVFLVEYKNASVSGATNPAAFRPHEEKRVDSVARKFYDSLHFLTVNGNRKPVKYVYIVEYPNADASTRKMLREKIAKKLPFEMQKGKVYSLIEDFDVVSIAEWNEDAEYSQFPLTPVSHGGVL